MRSSALRLRISSTEDATTVKSSRVVSTRGPHLPLNDLGFGFTFQQCFTNFLGYDYTTSLTGGKALELAKKAPYKWIFNDGLDEYLFWPKEGVEIHLEVVKDLFGHRYVTSREPRIISSKPIDTQIADTIE